MYGYVRPPAGILSEEELERFRRMYCGLCHTLGQRYGTAARFILNYDFTYLAILLSGGDEGPSTAARCMVSPLKKRDYLCTTDALALAADESVILAYWQLRDGVPAAQSRSYRHHRPLFRPGGRHPPGAEPEQGAPAGPAAHRPGAVQLRHSRRPEGAAAFRHQRH